MRHKQIDIVCIQEWSGNLRIPFLPNQTTYISHDNKTHDLEFPIKYFPQFKVHHIGTETAILYRDTLAVTPLKTQDNYDKNNRTENCHISSIILHSGTKDIGIHSVYNCPRNKNPEQFFDYNSPVDDNVFAGDFNMANVIWGSDKSTRKSNG